MRWKLLGLFLSIKADGGAQRSARRPQAASMPEAIWLPPLCLIKEGQLGSTGQ